MNDRMKTTVKLCPILENSFAECFCSRLESLVIPKVLKYCAGDYRECEVYQKHLRGDKSAAGNQELDEAGN